MNVAFATSYLAETPSTWADPPPVSTLTTLLVFVGIPLLAIAAISLLVMAPSLAKGPRYRPGQEWNADSEWIGATPSGSSASDRQLEAGASEPTRTEDLHDGSDSGGASARW